MKKVFLSTIFLFLLFPVYMIAQKSNLPGKLPWINGNLPENSINYNYKIGVGEGSNLLESQNKALEDLISQIGKEN